jgi:EAL domain-containing protein (putative c-di-GMP-specific phosphodiesterase class I)
MGLGLDMNVIAEGVETAAQQTFLESQGCLVYQGYLYGKPMPVEQFETWLMKS